MRQRAQGIEADTAFLQGEVEAQDEAAREEAELAAAEQQYHKQLAKEIGVSLSCTCLVMQATWSLIFHRHRSFHDAKT